MNIRFVKSGLSPIRLPGPPPQASEAAEAADAAGFGAWLREELTTLGPAYVKFGQAISTRTDLLPESIVAEMAKLQDNNQPADPADILDILEYNLGGVPWTTVFADFTQTPMATASIGQVHRARLLDGSEVVVKIQKPCVARQIREDIATLRAINEVARTLGSQRATEIENILQQNERFLSAELDYRKELRNMERFRELLQDDPVIVPRVYPDLSSDQVLVMEYVPSIKITETETLRRRGYDTVLIAENLVNLFLQMIVRHGFVHCDPHPGNIGVSPDSEDTLVLYDYGNVIELSKEFRGELNNMIFAIYQKDVDEFVELITRLGILEIRNDSEKMDVRLFFKSFFGYLESMDFSKLQASMSSGDMVSGGSVGNVKVNPDFLSLFRVFSLLDGTCMKLDPGFNYIRALSPFVENIMMDVGFFDYRARKDFAKLQDYPRIIQNTDQNLVRLDQRVKDIRSNQNAIQYALVGLLVIQHINDPVGLLAVAPIIVYILKMK